MPMIAVSGFLTISGIRAISAPALISHCSGLPISVLTKGYTVTYILEMREVVKTFPGVKALDGVNLYYQELNPILDMTVAENIFLGRAPNGGDCQGHRPGRGGRFRDISFDSHAGPYPAFQGGESHSHAGEILGFAGLVGAGRSEVMRAIFGLDSYSSGTISINGKPVRIRNIADAIKNSIAMVSEDRKMYGLALGRNIHENISL
jgi:ABC-type sugar transport system ATPase subunit